MKSWEIEEGCVLQNRFFYYGKYSAGGWCKVIQQGFKTKKDCLKYMSEQLFCGERKCRMEKAIVKVTDEK